MRVLIELLKDESQAVTSSVTNFVDVVMTEFEEHGQELSVDYFRLEELGILSQVLSQHKLGSPVVQSLIICFYNVLDELSSVGLLDLLQKDM